MILNVAKAFPWLCIDGSCSNCYRRTFHRLLFPSIFIYFRYARSGFKLFLNKLMERGFHITRVEFLVNPKQEQYQCDRAPCNNVVACYVDRPKQKTLVIYIMFATGCITVLVGLIEFFSLGMGKIYEAWANRHDGKLLPLSGHRRPGNTTPRCSSRDI